MKKLAGLLFSFIILVVSCQEDSGPRPVAEKFLEAMRDRNYQIAGNFGTQETVKLLQQFEKIEKLNGGFDPTNETPGKITIVSEDIKGKNATVYFLEEGNATEQHISLVKISENGKEEWKVALRKEEIRMMQE